MLPRPTKKKFTAAEYLAMEVVAEYKSEFYDGKIYAMSGGTADHNLVAMNLGGELRQRLAPTPCRVFGSDMRVHIEASGLYTYPDVMAICERIQFVMHRNDTVLNPVLIAEVLSQSTRSYDRGPKLNFYKGIRSLEEYVLVESEQPRIEIYRRTKGDEWVFEVVEGADATLALKAVDCTIPLSEIYSKVSWLS